MNGSAFVFPGQGSQKLGMGSDLAENFDAARLTFEEASDAAGLNLLSLCAKGPVEELNRTELTQPAVLTVSMAAYRVLISETDIRPGYVAGHSLGEWTAVTAAGGFVLSDAVSLVRSRGRFMQEASPEGEGAMAAVLGMEFEELDEICKEVGGIVVPANINCPGQIVISGEKAAVEDVAELSKERGAKRVMLLPVSVPSHSPLMEPVCLRLKEAMEGVTIRDLSVPLVNNVEGKTIRTAEEIREELIKQLVSLLRWEQSIREMASLGVKTFIELGPGKVLGNLISRIQPGARIINLEDSEGLKAIQQAAKEGEG